MNADERNILASKWRCSTRTVKRWTAQGAPLDDDKRMKSWLAARKNVPPAYAASTGTGAIERAVMLRRQGYMTPVEVVEMGNSVDLQIVQSVGKLHSIASELVGKTQAEIEARLTEAERQIYASCLCLIADRVQLL